MAQIDAFLGMMHEMGASDLHLSSGSQPVIRLHGELQRVKFKVLEHEELRTMLFELAPEEKVKLFEENGDLDFAYEAPGLARYRVNFFQQARGIAAVFREVPISVKNIDELGLPSLLKNLSVLPKGLVLVTGPTGSGKSSTLAAMVDHCNETLSRHILTIEDPIEFVHSPKQSLINQRELGRDTLNFQAALRGALREDPDVILVGEMRDKETIQLALEAAETGHLVLSTLHTQSAAKTVDRIIEVFPGEQQAQIRSSLAETLRAVVSQTLFKRKDGSGRVAALEILLGVPAVRNLIRENKTFQLQSVIETGRSLGMQTLDDAMLDLVERGVIRAEDAIVFAENSSRFRAQLAERSS
ncbi:type IV pilus twitching motility protein PilT [Desulfobaculum bizertense]|uniref:type IV pilus twitching motility protein PilT n=1 Tax=Desulfobaculum bizertense TaxID=376490 RepID=UPI001F417343|nr:type IV pilus twitching motility protein PilT [Desulfobaculum bizertense]UIJ38928.1 type IV pilus twitching motility protein PilT [Desulfobaculum bizertense]